MGCTGMHERCTGPRNLDFASDELRAPTPDLDNEFTDSSRAFLG